eukprot:TRINITY_DN1717_c0_g1_i4.p1 TRINITY_DN1717_c0_g1~~TRINITY_DN1717_c0_g1_i4.p1  ORF type:complete len:211 (-),score=39.34 TRINITY_DN1717_c0_g1_i4:265-897(-)
MSENKENGSFWDNSALLVMDYEQFILQNHLGTGETLSNFLARARQLLDAAREAGLPVIHVTVEFRPGCLEVSDSNKFFAGVKKNQLLIEGSEQVKIPDVVAPLPNEPHVRKRRINAFYNTDLQTVLSAARTRNGGRVHRLILAGVKTSGVILSTTRDASDRDYQITIVRDLCADMDAAAHECLMDRVFPSQADVVNSEFVISELQQLKLN